MSAYVFAKSLHLACVVLSLGGFAVRGALMLSGSPLLRARPVRVVPHVVDTLLLASALWLCGLIGQYPFTQGWLTAKVLGLAAYIGLGALALRGPTRPVRIAALAGAFAAAVYIVSVAVTKSPLGPLAG